MPDTSREEAVKLLAAVLPTMMNQHYASLRLDTSEAQVDADRAKVAREAIRLVLEIQDQINEIYEPAGLM